MNKKELKESIVRMESELKSMKEELAKPEKGWSPSGGEYFVQATGQVANGGSVFFL